MRPKNRLKDPRMAENLPEFKRPPVTETVLGVQFFPLEKLSSAHLGAFWNLLGEDWPDVNDAAPLQQEFERFGKDQQWIKLALRLNVVDKPTPRIQARNRANDRMIQLQNGRLHYNWLGHGG